MSNSIVRKLKLFTAAVTSAGGGSSAVWGVITGNINTQLDLKALLDSKLAIGSTTADINDSLNRRYVTDNQLNIINNTSNTNTGDETKSSIKTKLDLQSGTVNINFGISGDILITTITPVDPSWITANSKIICFTENDGIDHTNEDVYLENIISNVYNIVPGVSFDIITVAHNTTWGRYVIKYKEII